MIFTNKQLAKGLFEIVKGLLFLIFFLLGLNVSQSFIVKYICIGLVYFMAGMIVYDVVDKLFDPLHKPRERFSLRIHVVVAIFFGVAGYAITTVLMRISGMEYVLYFDDLVAGRYVFEIAVVLGYFAEIAQKWLLMKKPWKK